MFACLCIELEFTASPEYLCDCCILWADLLLFPFKSIAFVSVIVPLHQRCLFGAAVRQSLE